jgi:hypothetical protein
MGGGDMRAVTSAEKRFIAIHVISGRPQLDGCALAADTAFFTHPVDLVLTDDDTVPEITLRYLDQSDAIRLCMAAR